MKVCLITPWDNAWIPYFKQEIESRGHEFILLKAYKGLLKGVEDFEPDKADVYIHGWSSGASQPVPGARNIFCLRRYELFDGGISRVLWKNVEALVVCNSWIQKVVQNLFEENKIKVPVHLIYNGTDLNKWTFKERIPNNKIGMACHIHPKKNLPLALQVVENLPEYYELHIAGDIQDPCTAEYLNHLGKAIRRKVYLYGHIPREKLDVWWEQMGYCLSTSISEGNPNNVIEAMAKGIKPVIHNWPGAKDQFGKWVFEGAFQASRDISFPEYNSSEYRDWVSKYFSLKNISDVVDIALRKT